ncbi:unnamed protein product [Lactuca virosa]|uniref:Uncharacterized protein n=1 Tax=Lactuca virosa TaxID=75947 RepID=A0AAU9PIM3_9ASTR|nr:unnamed protein product [Lactuca virosa]
MKRIIWRIKGITCLNERQVANIEYGDLLFRRKSELTKMSFILEFAENLILRCGAIQFGLMDFGHLIATMLRSYGMLRLAMSEVVGTPMMTSFKTTPNRLVLKLFVMKD